MDLSEFRPQQLIGGGALGLDSSRDGCGGAANSWGGGGLALDLNLRHSAGNRRFPGSVPPLVYVHVQCMHVRVQTAAQLVCHFVIEERCIHMSIQCTFLPGNRHLFLGFFAAPPHCGRWSVASLIVLGLRFRVPRPAKSTNINESHI